MDGLYYLCSENKGADQLRGYREADLRLCFRICAKRFLMTRLIWAFHFVGILVGLYFSGKIHVITF